jgi:hypothetical protein
MITVKGRYDGMTVTLEKSPVIRECDVIVTFLNSPPLEPQPSPKGEGSLLDDGSLEYLFRDYKDDGIREPLVNFGKSVGNEQW